MNIFKELNNYINIIFRKERFPILTIEEINHLVNLKRKPSPYKRKKGILTDNKILKELDELSLESPEK